MAWYDYLATAAGGPIGGFAYNEISGRGDQYALGRQYDKLDKWLDGGGGEGGQSSAAEQAYLDQLRRRGNESRQVFDGFETDPTYQRKGPWDLGGMKPKFRTEKDPYGPYQEQAVQLGEDARLSDVNANLRRQLDMAEGRGPSLAGQQYAAANQDTQAGIMSMAAGGRGAQGARFAAQQRARVGAGMAQGVAEARTREQLGAMQQYNQSLSDARQGDYAREALNAQLSQQQQSSNQQAYMQMLQEQMGMRKAEMAAAGEPGMSRNERILNMIGTGAGAYLGGPGGAAAGGELANGVSDVAKPDQPAPFAPTSQKRMPQPGYRPTASNTIRTGPPVRPVYRR